jgi:hypothetical protein
MRYELFGININIKERCKKPVVGSRRDFVIPGAFQSADCPWETH